MPERWTTTRGRSDRAAVEFGAPSGDESVAATTAHRRPAGRESIAVAAAGRLTRVRW